MCFAGGGAYEHDIPTAVRALAGRSEFVTSYTPYQPELAQGVLQALFEYQTMLCRITGMDVANASLYDGASAAVEGLNLAAAATGRKLVWVSAGVRPAIRAVIRTLCGPRLRSGRRRCTTGGPPGPTTSTSRRPCCWPIPTTSGSSRMWPVRRSWPTGPERSWWPPPTRWRPESSAP